MPESGAGYRAINAAVQHVALRLAVVVSHPIQYFSPWFSYLARQPGVSLRVFYLWDFGVTPQRDRGFGVPVNWDIPLLDGYDYEFVENRSRGPGTHHFFGLNNPALVQRLIAWQPQVILLFGYAYLSHLRLMLSPALRHVPIIVRGDSHNLCRPAGFRSGLLRSLRRVLLARANAYLAVGHANKEYFRDIARDPRQIFLAPHFVDNQRFRRAQDTSRQAALAWRQALGISVDAVVIGFVGKLESNKRPLDLLRAFAALSRSANGDRRPGVELLFVGSGHLEAELREEVSLLGLRNVYFEPFRNQSQMPTVYSALDLLVLPSSSETWGLCVNEAMNLGVPAIVSNCVGCGPDLVIPNVTGWTFCCADVHDLQRVLIQAIHRTPEARAIMSEAVRSHVAQYSMERATTSLLEAIGSVTSCVQ